MGRDYSLKNWLIDNTGVNPVVIIYNQDKTLKRNLLGWRQFYGFMIPDFEKNDLEEVLIDGLGNISVINK